MQEHKLAMHFHAEKTGSREGGFGARGTGLRDTAKSVWPGAGKGGE